MIFQVLIRNSFHAIDLYFDVASSGNRIGNLVYRLLVNLHAVDGQARACIQFCVANVTLEMLGFLVLNQYLFIVKYSVAVPAKNWKQAMISLQPLQGMAEKGKR